MMNSSACHSDSTVTSWRTVWCRTSVTVTPQPLLWHRVHLWKADGFSIKRSPCSLNPGWGYSLRFLNLIWNFEKLFRLFFPLVKLKFLWPAKYGESGKSPVPVVQGLVGEPHLLTFEPFLWNGESFTPSQPWSGEPGLHFLQCCLNTLEKGGKNLIIVCI